MTEKEQWIEALKKYGLGTDLNLIGVFGMQDSDLKRFFPDAACKDSAPPDYYRMHFFEGTGTFNDITIPVLIHWGDDGNSWGSIQALEPRIEVTPLQWDSWCQGLQAAHDAWVREVLSSR